MQYLNFSEQGINTIYGLLLFLEKWNIIIHKKNFLRMTYNRERGFVRNKRRKILKFYCEIKHGYRTLFGSHLRSE